MRIIAGEFRGRRLLDPADQATRPVTDRVKQSLFDVLTPQLPGTTVYDVFAGTGSFGLESLSRGAESCVFFERHRPAVERLRRNIDTLGVAGRSRVMTGDVFKLSESDWTALPPAGVIFFDPPYPFLKSRPDDLQTLLGHLGGRLADDGLLLFRHDARDELPTPLNPVDERHYGNMRIRFLAGGNHEGTNDTERHEGE